MELADRTLEVDAEKFLPTGVSGHAFADPAACYETLERSRDAGRADVKRGYI